MTNTEIMNIFRQVAQLRPHNLSNNTMEEYSDSINRLVKYLDNKSIFDITSDDIKLYLWSLGEIADKTYNTYLSSFKGFFTVISYHPTLKGFIKSDPTVEVVRVKNPENKSVKAPLSKEEYFEMIRACKNKREVAVLTTMKNVGLRVSELIALTLEQYQDREIEYVNDKKVGIINLTTNKGSHSEAYVYINEETEKIIDEYLLIRIDSENNNLFLSNQGTPMRKEALNRTLKVIARRANFKEERVAQISNHLFRKTGATEKLNSGVAIDVVAKYLRHHGLGTVQIYAKTDNMRVMQAVI